MSKRQHPSSRGEPSGIQAGETPGRAQPRRVRPRRRKLVSSIALPHGRFQPRHCPNRHCAFYEPREDWKYHPWGTYYAPSVGREILRFRCRHCRRTFTARTYVPTYWLHRCDLLLPIVKASVAGSGIRQIARTLEVSHATVGRHLTRAGRHCLGIHRQMLKESVPEEPIAFDGFESFEHSQFFPYHFNLAAGHESWFIYHFTDSPLRRKGSMTAEQKLRRMELETRYGRPDPKAVENGVRELLATVLRLPICGELASAAGRSGESSPPGQSLLPVTHHSEEHPAPARFQSVQPAPVTLHSDEHPAYVRAVRSLQRDPACPPLRHLSVSSKDPRTRANPLFPVNLADLLLRHSGANHRRETIAYDRRRQGGLERLAVWTVWRNAIKWRRENKPGRTAAMAAGILQHPLTWSEVFAKRYFVRERELPGSWWSYYWRRVKTAALERQTENRAIFAF